MTVSVAPVPILYTQTGCADSQRVLDWLTGHGVSVIERNVTGDLTVAGDLAATGTFPRPSW